MVFEDGVPGIRAARAAGMEGESPNVYLHIKRAAPLTPNL